MAYELFGERGYRATVADIAAAADIAPRPFFSYFATKEDVVFYFGDQYCDAMQTAVESRPDGVSAFEALRQWVEQVLPAETVKRRRGCDRMSEGPRPGRAQPAIWRGSSRCCARAWRATSRSLRMRTPDADRGVHQPPRWTASAATTPTRAAR